MLGRLVGIVVGALIAALGYGLWKPAEFAKVVPPKYLDLATLGLGPFDQYKTIIAFVVMVLGAVIALAAIQRRGRAKKTRPLVLGAATVSEAPAAAPAHDPFTLPADDHSHADGHDHSDGHGHADSHAEPHGHGHGHGPAHA